MFSNKKGNEFMSSKTVNIILALAGLFVIGLILITLFSGGEFLGDLACKTSNYFSDQTNGVFPHLCYTRDVVNDENSGREVMYEVAESMRKCWSMWGEGELNPEGKNLWYDDEYRCFRCYRLRFSDFNGKISIKDFIQYLQTTEGVRGYDDTYWNYFNGRVMLGLDDQTYVDDMIRNDDYYAITFVEHLEKNRVMRYTAAATTGGAVFGGACMFIVGVGWIASPACVVAGGALGLISAAGEQVWDSFMEEDEDSIMLSKYEDVKLCAGYIK